MSKIDSKIFFNLCKKTNNVMSPSINKKFLNLKTVKLSKQPNVDKFIKEEKNISININNDITKYDNLNKYKNNNDSTPPGAAAVAIAKKEYKPSFYSVAIPKM